MSDKRDNAIEEIAGRVRAKGEPFPLSVSEIPDLPFDSFYNLSAGLKMGSVFLQRFNVNFDNNIFTLVASKNQATLNSAYILLAFLVPIICIIFIAIYSWWWLLGFLALPFFLARAKTTYNKAILLAASESEKIFCFLYVTGQICVISPTFGESYYWRRN